MKDIVGEIVKAVGEVVEEWYGEFESCASDIPAEVDGIGCKLMQLTVFVFVLLSRRLQSWWVSWFVAFAAAVYKVEILAGLGF